ncbi:GMC family oxidoreductase [Streptomyces mirabilis]|uniref:GMC family oxidoreductase n=1 Tax=Streptomyces mirabilis TaxID=68239 RepID=UPI0033DB0ECC
MNFLRGHRSGYDAWTEVGAEGWGYDDLLPYFKRSENLTGIAGRDPAVRGMDGPLRVGPAVERHPLAEAGLTAAVQAGHTEVRDLAGGLEEGFGWGDLNIADGKRQDAAAAYLRPVMDRPNLHVVTDALVHRVLLDGDHCTGIAGAVGTPQVLMPSGIGPRDHLGQVGIDTAVDLPGVGANLWDHPMSGIVYRAARPVPPGANNHGEVQGLIRSEPQVADPVIMVALMMPFSRGTVRLATSTPGGAPLLDPRYYTDSRDVAAMVGGLRTAREIGNAPALSDWRGEEALPGPAVHDDEQWTAYLHKNLRTYSHHAGTCRIGTDETAVVDPKLRVRGVSGLRVADASVMPSSVSANTNATVYAIAERAADLVRPRS